MPFVAPYVPVTDSGLDAWADNFCTVLAYAPALYGCTSGESAAASAAFASWHAAYLLCLSPSTKTAAVVAAKDGERFVLLAALRPLAIRISLNAGVDPGDKVAIGVNPRTSVPAPVTPPASNPVLWVAGASALCLVIRYRDSTTSPKVKSKPYGVTRLRLVGKTSATPVVDPLSLPFVADATKSPFELVFDASEGGRQVYLSGYWVIRTGGISPPASIINFTIPTA